MNQIGQSHDFWRAHSLFVARVASFAPEKSDGANDATRDTNKLYALQKSCDYHYFRYTRTNAPIQSAVYIVSCFKQTSRCLLELSKTVFLSRNELTVVNKRKLFIILLKWGGAGGGAVTEAQPHRFRHLP